MRLVKSIPWPLCRDDRAFTYCCARHHDDVGLRVRRMMSTVGYNGSLQQLLLPVLASVSGLLTVGLNSSLKLFEPIATEGGLFTPRTNVTIHRHLQSTIF